MSPRARFWLTALGIVLVAGSCSQWRISRIAQAAAAEKVLSEQLRGEMRAADIEAAAARVAYEARGDTLAAVRDALDASRAAAAARTAESAARGDSLAAQAFRLASDTVRVLLEAREAAHADVVDGYESQLEAADSTISALEVRLSAAERGWLLSERAGTAKDTLIASLTAQAALWEEAYSAEANPGLGLRLTRGTPWIAAGIIAGWVTWGR